VQTGAGAAVAAPGIAADTEGVCAVFGVFPGFDGVTVGVASVATVGDKAVRGAVAEGSTFEVSLGSGGGVMTASETVGSAAG
jgi:hypothetical protein